MRRPLLALTILLVSGALAAARADTSSKPQRLPGLKAAATITRDVHGIAHIRAANDDDVYFLQGYVHAQDRLFQMDVNRRRASGTLAELLGPAALAGDIELRTIGIRRAAERSLAVVSAESRRALEAYARGVNAYVASGAALPPEYAALELRRFKPWTALDGMAVVKLLTFGLSFGLDDIENTIALQTYSAVFDPALGAGTGLALFSQDLWRAQPFYLAATVPDASHAAPQPPRPPALGEPRPTRRPQRWRVGTPSACARCPSSRTAWTARSVRARTNGPWPDGARPAAVRSWPTTRTSRSSSRRRSTRSTSRAASTTT
jgi:Penicillin amidase